MAMSRRASLYLLLWILVIPLNLALVQLPEYLQPGDEARSRASICTRTAKTNSSAEVKRPTYTSWPR